MSHRTHTSFVMALNFWRNEMKKKKINTNERTVNVRAMYDPTDCVSLSPSLLALCWSPKQFSDFVFSFRRYAVSAECIHTVSTQKHTSTSYNVCYMCLARAMGCGAWWLHFHVVRWTSRFRFRDVGRFDWSWFVLERVSLSRHNFTVHSSSRIAWMSPRRRFAWLLLYCYSTLHDAWIFMIHSCCRIFVAQCKSYTTVKSVIRGCQKRRWLLVIFCFQFFSVIFLMSLRISVLLDNLFYGRKLPKIFWLIR